MTPSSTALIAFAVLAGYPLIQIAAIRLRRPLRLKFNGLVEAMRADPAYQGEAEQKALAGLMDASRGSPIIALAPIMLPLIAIAEIVVASEPPPRTADRQYCRVMAEGVSEFDEVPDSSPLWTDPRLVRAFEACIDLFFANWPLTMLLAVIVTIPLAVVAGIVAWVQRRTIEVFSPRVAALRLSRVFHAMIQT